MEQKHLLSLHQHISDNVECLVHLLLRNDERGREADDVVVRGLGQHALVLQEG